MTTSSPYVMLMASLPPLGDLFGQQQTPLTEIKLRHRLRFLTDQDNKTLSEIEQLVRRSKQPAEWTDAQIVQSTRALVAHLKSGTLRQAVEFVINLRTIVAALRRRRLGENSPPAQSDWGYSPWLKRIERNWTEPQFGLGLAVPWLPEARQTWPVRRALPQKLLEQRHSERLYPDKPLVTTQRIIDTFFPIALGGTGCIPGPFGAGKTVLQNLISRYSAVDIVVVVACGERAGEIVETISEFPKLTDPKTGGPLMERTIIICNTSSMPVAAREASIYTGITLGEYYRQMGYDVLLIADSTSRWAQAMRETSGRLEEIPVEEAYPAYLDSAIKGVYERAGVIRTNDGSTGSLTMIGTVSPAGGNFEEPVTQSTLATVKAFLGLSYERAYKRFYPAVDPLLSWSRYLAQLSSWFEENVAPGWVDRVLAMLELLRRGNDVAQMMQVTGEEGVSMGDHLVYQKSLFLDMVYLQQDAFDQIDSSASLPRQKRTFDLVSDLVNRSYQFKDKSAIRDYFVRLTGLFKNLNYSQEETSQYKEFLGKIQQLEASAVVTDRT